MVFDPKELEKQARKELQELLNEHPELRSLQEEVDRMLEAVGDDPLKRAQAMSELMMDVFKNELQPKMRDLQKILDDLEKKKKAS